MTSSNSPSTANPTMSFIRLLLARFSLRLRGYILLALAGALPMLNHVLVPSAKASPPYCLGCPSDLEDDYDDAEEDDDGEDPCNPPTANDGAQGTISCPDEGEDSEYGMPVWRVSEPFINLWIEDTPFRYRRSSGRWMELKLAYKQRADTNNFAIAGFGTNWGCNWIGYLAKTNDSPDILIARVLQGRRFGTTIGNGGTTETLDEEMTKRQIELQLGVSAKFNNHMGGYNGYAYTVTPSTNITDYLLTDLVDQYGRAVHSYWTNFTSGNRLYARLTKVVDRDGRTNTLAYDNPTFLNLITAVTGPSGTCSFTYDHLGRLTNIVDLVGMSSSFQYDHVGLITNMTTLYGPTSFRSFEGTLGDFPANRALEVTEPSGDKQLFCYRDCGTNSFGSMAGTYAHDDEEPAYRNSYHWDRKQYQALSDQAKTNYLDMPLTDYWKASLQHWLLLPDRTGSPARRVSPRRSASAGPVLNPGANDVRSRQMFFKYQDQQLPMFLDGEDKLSMIVWDGTNYMSGTNARIEIVRNSSARPTEVRYSFNGGTVSYYQTYSADGRRLESVTGPNNEMVRGYGYHTTYTNLLTSVTNVLGEVLSYTHDPYTMKVVRVDFPSGLVRSNYYYSGGDSNGFLKSTVDMDLSTTKFRTNSYTYLNGNVASHTDERGLVTSYSWDALGRLEQVSYPDGSTFSNWWSKLDVVATKDRMNAWTYYVYDSVRRLNWVTNANGQVTQYEYCSCGSVESVKRWSGTNYLFSQFNYDLAGRLTNAVYADNYQVSYEYDGLGRLLRAVDSGNREVNLAYNDYSQLASLLVGPAGARKYWSVRSYDEYGRMTNELDRNGVTALYRYDGLNRLTERSVSGGGTNSWVYTARGLTNSVDALGFTNWFVLDQVGRLLFQTNANGERLSFTYRPDGQMETLSDGKQQVTTWRYNEYGLVTNKVDATSTEMLRYAYDLNGRLTNRWTLEKGNTVFRYDPLGNVTNVDYPGTVMDVWFSYDGYSRLTNVVDAIGSTVFGWTSGDQLASEDGPWAADKVSCGYQNRSRTSLSLAQPNASPWSQSYAFDELGRLTNVMSPAGAFGTQYKSVTSSYGAMAAGLVSKMTLPGGSAIHNVQDGLGRLISTALVTAQQSTNNLHAFVYNNGNQRTKQTFKDGDYLDYTYDNIGQLKTAFGKEAGGASRLHEQFGYAYDAAWNLNWRTNNQLKQQFQVNSVNQLSSGSRLGTMTVAGSVTIPSASVTVSGTGLATGSAAVYGDGAWAIGGANLNGGPNNYTSTATAGSRTAQDTVNVNLPANPTYLYDRNGNLTNDGVRTLEYDFENQLTDVFVANGWRSQFSYDGFGRRRLRREYTWQGGAWALTNEVRYVYDGMLVVQERDANNLPLVSYTRGSDLSGSLQGAGGIGGLLARTENGLLLGGSPQAHAYYHADGNGNITCLVNTSNVVVARYAYDPYGNTLAMSGPLAQANLYRFSSKELHSNSGTYYYGFRFYEPTLQRWLNRDPLQERGGINLYGFVGSNPLSFIDSFGLHESPWYLRWFVPGQVAWDNAVTAWYEGDRSTAASWASMMLAEQALALAAGAKCNAAGVQIVKREALVAEAKEAALQAALERRGAAKSALSRLENALAQAHKNTDAAAQNMGQLEDLLGSRNSSDYEAARKAWRAAQNAEAKLAESVEKARQSYQKADAAARNCR